MGLLDPGGIRLRLDTAAAALEDIRRPLEQRLLPLMDHRRVDAEPARQLGNRLLAPFRATRALNSGLCCLRFVIAALRSLKTSRHRLRSLRHCPISGE